MSRRELEFSRDDHLPARFGEPKESGKEHRLAPTPNLEGTISDKGLLYQLEPGLNIRLDICPPEWGKRLLNQLAIGRVKGDLSSRGVAIRRGVSLFPQTQVLKDLFNEVRPVKKADDAHFPLALGADKRICFVDLSDKVGLARL